MNIRPAEPTPLAPMFAIGAAILVLVGSIGPWAKFFALTKSGTDGDGQLTLILSLIAGGCVLARILRRDRRTLLMGIAAACFAISAIVGIYDWYDVETALPENEFGFELEVGWGLVLVTIASIAGVILTGRDFLAGRKTSVVEAPESPETA